MFKIGKVLSTYTCLCGSSSLNQAANLNETGFGPHNFKKAMPVTPANIITIVLKIKDQFQKKKSNDRAWKTLQNQILSLQPLFGAVTTHLAERAEIQNAISGMADVLEQVETELEKYQHQGWIVRFGKADSNNTTAIYLNQQIVTYCGFIQLGISIHDRSSAQLTQELVQWFDQNHDSHSRALPAIITSSFPQITDQMRRPDFYRRLGRFLRYELDNDTENVEEMKILSRQDTTTVTDIRDVIMNLYDSYMELEHKNSELETDHKELHDQVFALRADEQLLKSKIVRTMDEKEIVQRLLIASQNVPTHFKHRLYTMAMFGTSGSGKTALSRRLREDDFESSFTTTIGHNSKIHNWSLGMHQIKMQIHDTPGQERFLTIAKAYLRDADVVICVICLTERWTSSTEYIIPCLKEALQERRDKRHKPPPSVVVVGTHLDCCFPVKGEFSKYSRYGDERMATKSDIEDDLIPKIKIILCKELLTYLESVDPEMKIVDLQAAIPQFHMPLVWYHEVSSKTGENIEDLRATLTIQIAHRLQFPIS